MSSVNLNPENLHPMQIVVFKAPYPSEQRNDGTSVRMLLLEVHDNGRCLVEYVDTGMHIAPTQTVLISDLTGNFND